MDTSSHPLPETFLQTLSLQQCPTEGPHLQFCPHPQALPSSPPPRVLPALLPQGPSSSLLPGSLQLWLPPPGSLQLGCLLHPGAWCSTALCALPASRLCPSSMHLTHISPLHLSKAYLCFPSTTQISFQMSNNRVIF